MIAEILTAHIDAGADMNGASRAVLTWGGAQHMKGELCADTVCSWWMRLVGVRRNAILTPEDGVVLRTAAQAVAHAQAIAKWFADGGKHASVSRFLAHRKVGGGE